LTRRELLLIPLIGFIKPIPIPIPTPHNAWWVHYSGDGCELGRTPVDLRGIPYHQSNASTGQWLGFKRK
jgi:hypothetical protein